jgi:hypothetical protein
VARPVRAESRIVPPALQVALFNKIFQYDTTLRPPFEVLILYAKEFVDMAGDVQAMFEKTGQATRILPVGDFEGRSSQAAVICVLARSLPSAVQDFCVRSHVFSVSPITSLAERGEVSVAIGLKEDRTAELVVHLPRSKSEGQNLQMALLALARVIR